MAQVTEEVRDALIEAEISGVNQSQVARNGNGDGTPWVENSGVLSSQELGREALGKPQPVPKQQQIAEASGEEDEKKHVGFELK